MENKLDGVSDEPRKMSFQLLKEITNNFDPERKLGSGASGEVYKGVFKDGKVIAVKKLRFMPWSDDKQFQNEFEHLTRLKHPNIVRLVGFCDETEDVCVTIEGQIIHAVRIHRALCLEYVPNGGLGQFLYEKHIGLNWRICYKIIQGTCQGLKYLHKFLTMHFDLKPDNILLDEKMTPKIADFGLSRLLGEENTVMTKSPLGTIGYLPPEFINKQVISNKYDIFSLGVIIKRIMTGKEYFEISHMDDNECIEHVHNSWRKRLQEIPDYPWLEVDCKQVRNCIEIAVDCTKEDPRKRPTINKIVSRITKGRKIKNISKDCIEETLPLQDEQFFDSVPERSSLELEVGDNHMENKSLLHMFELPFEFLCEITNNFSEEQIVSYQTSAIVFK
jgi:coatomer subunit beta'